MKLNNYPLSRKSNIVVQEAADEVLLYDLSDNKAYCLNETSAAVWDLCDGKSSVAEINEKLSQKMKQSTSEELVWLALDQLKKEKLLANHEEISVDYNGMSRREAVRKVGLASLIALPVIMSLNTPVAATAASVCGGNLNQLCQCNDNGCTGGAPTATILAGSTCQPIVGGVNCMQLSAACVCISSGNCVGNTGLVSGVCG